MLREITEFKKFLQDNNITCFTIDYLFDKDNWMAYRAHANNTFIDQVKNKTLLFLAFENFVRNICSFTKEYNHTYSNLSKDDHDFFESKEISLRENINVKAYQFMTCGVFEAYKGLAHAFTNDIAIEDYPQTIAYVLHLAEKYLPNVIYFCNERDTLKTTVKLENEVVKIDFSITAEKATTARKKPRNGETLTESHLVEPPAKRAKVTDKNLEIKASEAKNTDLSKGFRR